MWTPLSWPPLSNPHSSRRRSHNLLCNALWVKSLFCPEQFIQQSQIESVVKYVVSQKPIQSHCNEKYPIAEAYNLPKASMGGTGCVIAKVRIAGLLHHSMVFSIP